MPPKPLNINKIVKEMNVLGEQIANEGSHLWTPLGNHALLPDNIHFMSDNLHRLLPQKLKRRKNERRISHLRRCCNAMKDPTHSKNTIDLLSRMCAFLAITNQ